MLRELMMIIYFNEPATNYMMWNIYFVYLCSRRTKTFEITERVHGKVGKRKKSYSIVAGASWKINGF